MPPESGRYRSHVRGFTQGRDEPTDGLEDADYIISILLEDSRDYDPDKFDRWFSRRDSKTVRGTFEVC